YPLKFLYGWIVGQFTGAPTVIQLPGGEQAEVLKADQIPTLMLLAGLGWLAGIVVFGLLYWHAYALRGQLDLNPLETFATREELQNWALAAGVTLAALGSLLIVPAEFAAWTLAVYVLYFPLRAWHRAALNPRRRQLLASASSGPP